MFILIYILGEYDEYLAKAWEHEVTGEIDVDTTTDIDEAMKFETEELAREYKNEYRLRVWIQKI